MPLDQAVGLEALETSGDHLTGRSGLRLEILKPGLSQKEFAHDQDRPAVANEAGGMRNGAQRVAAPCAK